jgi:hypothetical protein
VFLALIVNALPLLGLSSSVGDVGTGAVTLLALALFRGDSLLARARRLRGGSRG